jgi:hypothetical protein
MAKGTIAATWHDRNRRAGGAAAATPAPPPTGGAELIMPYHVYAQSGPGAFGVIVETAREALAKAAQFVEDGHPEVRIKDLLGNVLTHAAVTALAEGEIDRS